MPDRQGGRDKSVPRPYETDPFHPLSSTYKTVVPISIYIEQSSGYFFHMVRLDVY